MDAITLISGVILTIPPAASAIACLCLFRAYCALPKQTFGIKLIVMLCISDFVFSVIWISNVWEAANDIEILETKMANILMNCALRFSVVWVSSIAYLVLRSVQNDGIPNPEHYSKMIFIITLIACIILSTICVLLGSNCVAVALTLTSPLSLSLIFTAGCYLKSASILKESSTAQKGQIKPKLKNLYLYSFIQLITTVPAIVYTQCQSILTISSLTWELVAFIPLGSSGFINTMVYFFLRQKTDPKETGTTTSISNSKELLAEQIS